MSKLTKVFPIAFLVIISIFSLKTLFHSGFYTSHDGWHQVARLYHWNKAILDTQFPPRISTDLMNGFGYPLFIFSYHLPWLIAEPFVLMNFSIFASIKIVFILTFVLSGLTMYGWIRDMLGSKAGFISAFLYLFTPYRFANILVRANIGEAVSFLFYPLVFWALYRFYKDKSNIWIVIGAIGVAGILLSHVMVVFLFALTILSVVLYFFTVSKKRKLFLIKTIGMFCLGIGLTAYYLLPAIYYKNMTVFTQMYHDLYKNYFTPLSKLLYSPWGYGALGTAGEMSRQVGLVIWITLILSATIIIYKLLINRSNNQKKMSYPVVLPGIFILSFIISVFMMTTSSNNIWRLIEPMGLVDFPWRFLAITSFCGSVLGGYVINAITQKNIQAVIIVLYLVVGFYTNRNHIRVNQYTDIPLWLYLESEVSTNTDDEYLPIWVNRQQAKEKTQFIQAENIQLDSIVKKTNQINFNYFLSLDSQVKIHQMYFPGWKLYIDNQPQKIEKSDIGGMQVQFPAGQHAATLKYTPTFIMRTGVFLSVISLVVILLLSKTYMAKKIHKL